jgi:hypothetical protein
MSKILEAYGYPTFQNVLYETREEAVMCPKGDIELVQDKSSGLIYNEKFSDIAYDSNYHNEQEYSPFFRKHLVEVSEIVERAIGKCNLLEIGSGKGYFLEKLLSRGLDIEGMDPCYDGNNQKIKKSYYEANGNKTYDGIILRHVLEHIQNPYEFLADIKEHNKNKGFFYIEVPCFDWINENCMFTDIFYEHVNYFRMLDFRNMFDEIVDAGKLFGGQYLYVVAKVSSLKKPTRTDNFELNKDFWKKLHEYRTFITNLKKSVIIWGCASKGVIFSVLLGKLCEKIYHFIDINPNRQNK